ncbi:unnamed protein product [Prorocentrum cordatum]|uniref:Uncharacterized protein n=1 Tax=Prorocentrum cordatum TaxID=2364126 RepID=A0ABN9UCK6_9DINO|nr:unnamed protein product [Polarella glacialis]
MSGRARRAGRPARCGALAHHGAWRRLAARGSGATPALGGGAATGWATELRGRSARAGIGEPTTSSLCAFEGSGPPALVLARSSSSPVLLLPLFLLDAAPSGLLRAVPGRARHQWGQDPRATC